MTTTSTLTSLLFKDVMKSSTLDTPVILFFHESILNAYGLCPYVRADAIPGSRRTWLDSNQDCSNAFDILRDIVISSDHIRKYDDACNLIDSYITQHLSNPDKYAEIKDIFTRYYTKSIRKTVSLKSNLKRALVDLACIQLELNSNIPKYFEIIFDTIVQSPLKTTNTNAHFDTLLDDLLVTKHQKELHETKISNITFQCNEYLNEYLADPIMFIKTRVRDRKDTRYSEKKWQKLSHEQQNERIYEYAIRKAYINVHTGVIPCTDEDVLKFVDTFILEYKDYTPVWDSYLGCISKMNKKLILSKTNKKKKTVLKELTDIENAKINTYILTALIKQPQQDIYKTISSMGIHSSHKQEILQRITTFQNVIDNIEA